MTRTNTGADWQAGVLGSTSSNGSGAYAAANYMAVSANTAPAYATDVSLPGEIVAGTMVRVQATYAHTNGTSSYTLTNVFTSDQTIILQKLGILNAASGGTLVFETQFTPAPLNSGDQILIVETVNL
jgi:hypothetical protein